eukprot:gene25031-10676_t
MHEQVWGDLRSSFLGASNVSVRLVLLHVVEGPRQPIGGRFGGGILGAQGGLGRIGWNSVGVCPRDRNPHGFQMLRLSSTPALTHRSRAALPKPSRKVLTVSCAIHDPYSTLGVASTSDEQTIKKAFRKQALKCHPDVSKEIGADVKFLKLTEAYEFLMRQMKGDLPDHFEGASSQEGSWDFHDWYWQFRINRNWSKQAKKSYADSESSDEEATHQRAAFEPGHSRQETKKHVHSQLAGLRKRAAARKSRPSCSDSESESEEAAPQMQPQHSSHSSPFGRPNATSLSTPASTASEPSQEDSHAQPSTSRSHQSPPSSPKVHVPPATTFQDQTWSAVDSFSGSTFSEYTTTASFEDLWGGQGQEHEAFNKFYTPGSESANPVHDASADQSDMSSAFSIGAYNTADECAAAGASSAMNGFARGHYTRTAPSFAATQDRKEAVMHQLAGLKRKSNFARQH